MLPMDMQGEVDFDMESSNEMNSSALKIKTSEPRKSSRPVSSTRNVATPGEKGLEPDNEESQID